MFVSYKFVALYSYESNRQSIHVILVEMDRQTNFLICSDFRISSFKFTKYPTKQRQAIFNFFLDRRLLEFQWINTRHYNNLDIYVEQLSQTFDKSIF